MKTTVETEIQLLKKEVSDMKQIHVRLDTAIEKIADVSSSLHTILKACICRFLPFKLPKIVFTNASDILISFVRSISSNSAAVSTSNSVTIAKINLKCYCLFSFLLTY